MQRLEVSGAVRLIYKSLGVNVLNHPPIVIFRDKLVRREEAVNVYKEQAYSGRTPSRL